MPSLQKPTIEDVRAVLQRMASNAADAAALAATLPDMISNVPPVSAQLLSRPHFERASLWSYVASFENVEFGHEAPPEVIRFQQPDLWVRGVEVTVIPGLAAGATMDELAASLFQLQQASLAYGTNGRFLFECNWRLDDMQGFISTGISETLEVASLLAGDGSFSAALDWQLQKDQTIEVRVNSLVDRLFPINPTALVLRWITVVFWVERLDQQSVRI